MASKQDVIRAVAQQADIDDADAERILASFFEFVTAEAKAGEKVAWPGYGSFSMTERGARIGRNPRTGEVIDIGPSRTLKFTSAVGLKKWLMEE